MKTKLFFTYIIACSWFVGYSQDIITLRNGEEIQAKVIKVGNVEIEYKKFSNLNGPAYTIEKSTVFMIKYENGSKDVFEEKKISPEVPPQIAPEVKKSEIKTMEIVEQNVVNPVKNRYERDFYLEGQFLHIPYDYYDVSGSIFYKNFGLTFNYMEDWFESYDENYSTFIQQYSFRIVYSKKYYSSTKESYAFNYIRTGIGFMHTDISWYEKDSYDYPYAGYDGIDLSIIAVGRYFPFVRKNKFIPGANIRIEPLNFAIGSSSDNTATYLNWYPLILVGFNF